jgi:hypothetical protein
VFSIPDPLPTPSFSDAYIYTHMLVSDPHAQASAITSVSFADSVDNEPRTEAYRDKHLPFPAPFSLSNANNSTEITVVFSDFS